MIEFYPQIKSFHVLCAFASVTLFALRGALNFSGSRWGMAAPVRYLSYSIDTALLTAALMLLTLLPGAVFANQWLTVKMLLLVAYVALGTFALKRGRTAKLRWSCYFAALGLIVLIFGIARAHHPWGWFSIG